MIAQGNQYIAVLDTCVLAPMPLCDTLLRLAEDPAFYIPKWSDDVLRELRSTLQRMGYTPAQAGRRVTAMETAFEDAKITGYESLASSMTNDAKDRHVLAAAVRCGAHAIITENVRHFPLDCVKPYDLDVLTPDEFLIHQFNLNPELFAERLAAQAAARKTNLAGLLTRLSRRAPKTCAALVDWR
jgi:predicted nucleic acid-binding protein